MPAELLASWAETLPPSEVDVVLGGVEGDAGELGAVEVDAAVGEVVEEVFAGGYAGGRLANDLDDRVEVVEGDLVAEQDVFALAGLVEEEGGAAADYVDAVVDEGVDGLVEGKLLGLAVVDGQEDHGEAFLHLGVLVELVEDDFVLRAALEFDDDAHAVAVGLIADVGDVVDDFFVDELGDALDEVGLVDLVGDLGDDDGLASAGDLLEAALGAHHEAAATGLVGLGDVGAAVDEAAGGEVGTLDVLEGDFEVGAGFGLLALEEGDGGVEGFGEVVRRDVGRHADGDAGAAVDDEVGDAGGEDGGLGGGLVVVGDEVYGVVIDVGEHFARRCG